MIRGVAQPSIGEEAGIERLSNPGVGYGSDDDDESHGAVTVPHTLTFNVDLNNTTIHRRM